MKKPSSNRGQRGSQAQKRVVILGLNPVDALDVIGPAEVFTVANRLYGGEVAPYRLELVSSTADLQLQSATGIGLIAHKTLAQERLDDKPIDTLIVASGWDSASNPDREAMVWIRERSANMRRVCSICVAAFALAGAGLLDGRRATTHWGMARELAERFPMVEVDANPIWIKDGHIYTSAGISAGIDLALALVGEDLGDEMAMDIAKNLVLFLRRPGGQAQFSVTLQSQRASGSSLDKLCVWISEHLHTELTVEILADRMSTSVRTLIRQFARDLKTTPAKYVEDVRLEAACRAFEMGGRSMEEIARRCGYNSVDVLRKAFVRRLGVSPKEYAMRFARDDRSVRSLD
ncbi:helix-turn-helix domain-containing protein [Pseudomonas putida]|uniref:Helix-turn-helix domain-containing protein n=1 Tax=Pseudomonas putida TaxID=303 RepID=A0A2Z4RFD9_PSEPU|nr:helix-turn-helix domain-containing protein [Pseudomonas putida]AWY39870.1 helix-turn-helix domain-containing protein [Pseudomonas putida]